MSAHVLKAVQKIPVSLERAWDYFSDPMNLQAITPSAMKFRITSHDHGRKVYPGQIIEYTVAPIAGISMYWMTEITHVQPMDFFIDEQRYGPYSMWQHQHHFKVLEGGIEMTDIVHYKMPMGLLGKMMNPLLVKPRLDKIFHFRFKKVEEIFGKWDEKQ